MPVEYEIIEVREAFGANPRTWHYGANYKSECGRDCWIQRFEKVTENGIEYIVGYEREYTGSEEPVMFKIPAASASLNFSAAPPFKPSL